MIKLCSFNSHNLCITTDVNTSSISWNKDVVGIVNDDCQILVHSRVGEREELNIVDSVGKICGSFESNNDFSIMYLSKHPRFGLCAVCSAKQADGSWKDGFYKFDGNGYLVRATNFR